MVSLDENDSLDKDDCNLYGTGVNDSANVERSMITDAVEQTGLTGVISEQPDDFIGFYDFCRLEANPTDLSYTGLFIHALKV